MRNCPVSVVKCNRIDTKLKDALIGLNFLTVEFDIAVRPGQTITAKDMTMWNS